jgi:hypothetical protein
MATQWARGALRLSVVRVLARDHERSRRVSHLLSKHVTTVPTLKRIQCPMSNPDSIPNSQSREYPIPKGRRRWLLVTSLDIGYWRDWILEIAVGLSRRMAQRVVHEAPLTCPATNAGAQRESPTRQIVVGSRLPSSGRRDALRSSGRPRSGRSPPAIRRTPFIQRDLGRVALSVPACDYGLCINESCESRASVRYAGFASVWQRWHTTGTPRSVMSL